MAAFFVRRVGISFLTGTVQVSYFFKAELLKNLLNLFESYTQGVQTPCSDAQYKNSPMGSFYIVRRVGFEPTKTEVERVTISCDRPLHHRRKLELVHTILFCLD